MKIVNDSIKNALKQPTTQRKGRILVDGNYYEVFNVEYYADAYNEGNVIGNAIASQLDFDLPYIDKFDTFKYFDGVWTGNDYEYVDMGTFHVFDEQDEDEFNKHITAFDNLIKFNVPYVDNNIYPKTIFEELQNICEQAGVELVNDSIANGNFEIQDNQFVNNESLKSVLKAICQISGTYAIIKNDELILQLKNETTEVINKNQHAPMTWKRKTYGINQVILGLEDVSGEYVIRQDEEDIAINGVHKLVINDNAFAYTQEKRDLLIDELFNQVRGFGYIPYEVKGEWLNYIEIGDTINIDGIDTILLRINGKSPKSIESEMSAPAIINSAIQYYDNTASIKNTLKRAEIIVDKQSQTIQSITETTDQITNSLGDVYTKTQINDLIQNAENGLTNTFSQTGGQNLLFNAIGNFGTDYWQTTNVHCLSSFSNTYIKNKSGQRSCFYLNNGNSNQTVQVANGIYVLSGIYEKLIPTATHILKINGIEYDLLEEFEYILDITNNSINIEILGDADESGYLMNLMLNKGNIKQEYSNNANETITDTVKIGKGIQIEATGSNSKFDAQADGIRIIDINTNQTSTEFTDKGTITKNIESDGGDIANLLIKDTGSQTWLTRL